MEKLARRARWAVDCMRNLHPPRIGASERAVAEYIFCVEAPGSEDANIFDVAREFCKTEGFADRPGFSIQAVFDELTVLAGYAYALLLLEKWGPIPSDDYAWLLVEHGNCPKPPRWFLRKQTGRSFAVTTPCGGLSCPRCAAEAAEGHFLHAGYAFREADHVYVLIYPDGTERFEAAVRKRRSRLTGALGGGLGWFRVHRPGEIHLYSTHNLSQLTDPVLMASMVSPLAALAILRARTLALPRLLRAQWSGPWKLPQDPPRTPVASDSFTVGMASRRTFEAAKEAADDMLLQQTGIGDPSELSPDRIEKTYLPILKASLAVTVAGNRVARSQQPVAEGVTS